MDEPAAIEAIRKKLGEMLWREEGVTFYEGAKATGGSIAQVRDYITEIGSKLLIHEQIAEGRGTIYRAIAERINVDEHLPWLVQGRAENQKLTLRLYQIIQDHRDIMSDNESPDLDLLNVYISVCFSLWRAIFLGEVKGKDLLTNSEAFLKNLIDHNAVTYQSDYKTREYTFAYYITIASTFLNQVHSIDSSMVSEPVRETLLLDHPREDWRNAHEVLARAIYTFEVYLVEKKKGKGGFVDPQIHPRD